MPEGMKFDVESSHIVGIRELRKRMNRGGSSESRTRAGGAQGNSSNGEHGREQEVVGLHHPFRSRCTQHCGTQHSLSARRPSIARDHGEEHRHLQVACATSETHPLRIQGFIEGL